MNKTHEVLLDCITLGKKADEEFEQAKKVLLEAQKKRNNRVRDLAKQYFKELVRKLNMSQEYLKLLESDNLFQELDAKLSRHHEYDVDNGPEYGHWVVGDFSLGHGPTLFERYPLVKQQIKDLEAYLPADKLSFQYKLGFNPWHEGHIFRTGKEITDILLSRNSVKRRRQEGVKNAIIELLTETADFGSESFEHQCKIIDLSTQESVCPNKDFADGIGLIQNWYLACKKLIGNPLGIIVKENAKKWYHIPEGRDPMYQ